MARSDGVPSWVWMVGIGVAGYAVYQWLHQTKQNVINPIAQTIADWWVNLTAQPPMQVLGSVVLPNGNLVPLSQLTVKTDASNNVYIAYQGQVYSLSPQVNGNYPATLVTSPPS